MTTYNKYQLELKNNLYIFKKNNNTLALMLDMILQISLNEKIINTKKLKITFSWLKVIFQLKIVKFLN